MFITASSAQFKICEDHAVAANTQPADILAFTVTSLKIHTQPHLYSPAPIWHTKEHFSSIDRSLTTTGKHTIYYQTLTHHIVHKYRTF